MYTVHIHLIVHIHTINYMYQPYLIKYTALHILYISTCIYMYM